MEDKLCDLLTDEGISYERQVSTGWGRADVVTDDTVYEVKLDLTQSVLFKAIGQVTLYAAALKKPRRVIWGRMPDSDTMETLRVLAHSQGIRINVFPRGRSDA
jgi:hypothetical protein